MFDRLIVYGGALLVAGGTVLALDAHAAAQASSSQKATTGAQASVSATGCLERWTSDPQSSDPSAQKAPAGVEYVLTHIEGRTASKTGTSEAGTAGPATRYLLLPNPQLAFAKHLNHKVRVVGSIAPQPSPGASPSQVQTDPSSRETNLPGQPRAAAYSDNLLDATSLTMVSGKCEER